MNIELGPERPADYRAAEHATREAFWNHFSPGCDEHYLLHIMRDCLAFVPELSFVAVHDGRVIGSIVYMESVIKGDNGRNYTVLSLGPISVVPEYQREGVGRGLIAHTRALAWELGFRAILLYGDPAYYARQGFVPAERFGIRTADNMYADALQVCELYEGALDGVRGRYVEDAVYEVDRQAAALFDRDFPPKEKVSGTPSQKRFEQVVAMRKHCT